MKESNIFVSNAAINQLQRAILQDIKGQHMNELDSNAGIVINNKLTILQSTKEIYINKSQALHKVCA